MVKKIERLFLYYKNRAKRTLLNYKKKGQNSCISIKKFLILHSRYVLYFLLLIVGIYLIASSFSAKDNWINILSGVGTGLLTSLVVSAMINAENDAREKRRLNKDRHFILNDIVDNSLDVYEDIIYKINEFIIFSGVSVTPVYEIYDNFSDYNVFEKAIKQIDYNSSPQELINQLNTLLNFGNYKINFFIGALKRLSKQDYYLKGLLSQDEYRRLTSDNINNEYLEYSTHISDFWDNGITDIEKCIKFLGMTLYVSSKVISALDYCKKTAVKKETSVKKQLSQRSYEEIYCFSEEYFEKEAERDKDMAEYYAAHPEECEELQRQEEEFQNETPEDKILKDLYYCICGFSIYRIEDLLYQLDTDSKTAIAFFCTEKIQKSLRKKRNLNKAVKVKFGKDYLKKFEKSKVNEK